MIYQINWNLCKFCNISINFKDTKMADHFLKIFRPCVFDIVCLSWNTIIIAFMKKCCMDRRWYKSCHWTSMCLLGHPCTILPSKRNIYIWYSSKGLPLQWYYGYSFSCLMHNIDFIDKNTFSLNTFNSKPLFQAKPESNTFVWV